MNVYSYQHLKFIIISFRLDLIGWKVNSSTRPGLVVFVIYISPYLPSAFGIVDNALRIYINNSSTFVIRRVSSIYARLKNKS